MDEGGGRFTDAPYAPRRKGIKGNQKPVLALGCSLLSKTKGVSKCLHEASHSRPQTRWKGDQSQLGVARGLKRWSVICLHFFFWT